VRLSVVVPAYNEEATIRAILERVRAVEVVDQIVVVNDSSTDGTRAQLSGLDWPDLTVIHHDVNQGKGAAIRTALAAARGDYVLIQDADLEYEVSDYPALLQAINGGADVVYGSRFRNGTRPGGMRAANYAANRILTASANLLYGLSITDEATCFKVFRTDLLRELELECEGFEFCPEVTAKLGRRGVDIAEVPIHYRARNIAEGKKVRWTDGVEALWVLIKHRLRRS
jgi:dolichol-phosphate mannosyltransferase